MHKLSSLLESGKYSDLKITCGSKEWLVHKAIICTQSEYFAAICDSNFKEGLTSEIDLSSNPPGDIEQMLKFLYNGTYEAITAKDLETSAFKVASSRASLETHPAPGHLNNSFYDETNLPDNWDEDENREAGEETTGEEDKDSETPALSLKTANQLHHVAMYVLGDRYLIPELKLQATEKFFNDLPDTWDPSLWPVVKQIDDNTSPGDQILRGFIIELCLKNSELLSDTKFRDKLAQFPDLELPVLRKYAVLANTRINELEKLPAVVTKLEKEIHGLKLDMVQLQNRINGVKTIIRSKVLPLTTEWSHCRNCAEAFNCHLEEYDLLADDTIGLFLRCNRCQAKHKHGGKFDEVEF
ncbi:hypothetical protein ABW21_db0205608 [Orbilia brochopaga]|nr:hypothetical protein ABW21_db0205608 [Drechslerella brochopaga]